VKLPEITPCDDLDEAIEEYKALGYRLDMIFPADNPREALLSQPYRLPAQHPRQSPLTGGLVRRSQALGS